MRVGTADICKTPDSMKPETNIPGNVLITSSAHESKTSTHQHVSINKAVKKTTARCFVTRM